jgi:hypothetical protein
MPGEESKTKPSLQNIASFVSLRDLKNCTAVQLCYKIQFNGSTNVMQLGSPAVHPVQPIRLQKDKVHKLF